VIPIPVPVFLPKESEARLFVIPLLFQSTKIFVDRALCVRGAGFFLVLFHHLLFTFSHRPPSDLQEEAIVKKGEI
jgi:hypothetical protein